MAYSNSVTLLDTEGGPLTTKVVARLWRLYSSSFGMHDMDENVDFAPSPPPYPWGPGLDVRLDQTQPAAFSFGDPTSFANHPVGLSLQDQGLVLWQGPTPPPNEHGWLFRSGAFTTLPSTSPIDLIAAIDEIHPADIASFLAATPLTVDSDTSLTSLTGVLADPAAPLGGGIDITLTGTTTGGVGWEFGGRLVPSPSAEIAEPRAEAVRIDFVNENKQLTGGATLPYPDEQALWTAVRNYVTNTLAPQLRRHIGSHVENRIVGAIGRPPLSAGLPAGVSLSVRTISATSQHLAIRGVLGSFGRVDSKLPGAGGGGGGTGISCPFTMLDIPGLDVLRAVRDGTLAASEVGRWAVDAYYRFGGEASALLARNPRLAARTAQLAREVVPTLRAGRAMDSAQRRRAEALLRDFATVGSPELRTAVAAALDSGVTSLL
jgi:hypothetical protein